MAALRESWRPRSGDIPRTFEDLFHCQQTKKPVEQRKEGGTNVYKQHYNRVRCNSTANNPHRNLVESLTGYAPVEGEDAGFDQEQSDEVLQLVAVPELEVWDKDFVEVLGLSLALMIVCR